MEMEENDGTARWGARTWSEFAEERARRQVAIVPVGAIEEHGPHLPLDTDNIMAEALASLVAARTGAFLLPLVPYGQVWSLRAFAGSLTVPAETLTRFACDLALSLGEQGMRVVVFLSGHLGNMAALKEAARQVMLTGGPYTVYLNYPDIRAIAAGITTSPVSHPAIIHSDEIETSLMLAVAPDKVHMERAVREYPEYPTTFEHDATGWETLSRSGVFGDARAATREKGLALLTDLVDKMVAIVETANNAVGERPQNT